MKKYIKPLIKTLCVKTSNCIALSVDIDHSVKVSDSGDVLSNENPLAFE